MYLLLTHNCFAVSKFKSRKMFDFVSKSAIKVLVWHELIKARKQALEFKPFLIGHIQYVVMKEEDQIKKNINLKCEYAKRI